MKKFIIFYTIFSFVLLAGVYLITVVFYTQERTLELFYQKAEGVIEHRDLDTFIKFQSIGFKHLYTEQNQQYDFYVYQILAKENDVYINQFSVFVIPKTAVNFADRVNDLNDQTSIKLTKISDNEVYYDSILDKEYVDYAVSYGIKRMGFYYFAVPLNEDLLFHVALYDYAKQEIYHHTIDYTYVTHDGKTTPEGFVGGYTPQEIEALLDMPNYLRKPLRNNLILFAVFDLSFGASIYYFIKVRKEKKHMKLSSKS